MAGPCPPPPSQGPQHSVPVPALGEATGEGAALWLPWERLWGPLGLILACVPGLVDVTFTLQARWAQVQEPAAEGENPLRDWSCFPLTVKELLQTFLWPGVEFRSLAWPLLPQPFSLLLSFSPKASMSWQLCSPRSDRDCTRCLWVTARLLGLCCFQKCGRKWQK